MELASFGKFFGKCLLQDRSSKAIRALTVCRYDRFQFLNYRQPSLKFSHDTLLFGERWDSDRHVKELFGINPSSCGTVVNFAKVAFDLAAATNISDVELRKKDTGL